MAEIVEIVGRKCQENKQNINEKMDLNFFADLTLLFGDVKYYVIF